jgi:hypothetical protein
MRAIKEAKREVEDESWDGHSAPSVVNFESPTSSSSSSSSSVFTACADAGRRGTLDLPRERVAAEGAGRGGAVEEEEAEEVPRLPRRAEEAPRLGLGLGAALGLGARLRGALRSGTCAACASSSRSG